MESIFQFRPNKLTFWASRNVPFAIALIVGIELVKFSIGFYLGKNAFPVFSADSLSIIALLTVVTVFVTQNYFKEKIATAKQKATFGLVSKGNLVVFTASFLLSFVSGNQWSRIENPTANADVFAVLKVERKTEINVDSLIKAVEEEQKLSTTHQAKEPRTDDGMLRLGYFALFALAMILTYFGLFLACSLACSGLGFLAAIVFILDLGIFSGGIYFLLKVFRQGQMKPWREMDKTARKKEGKRFRNAMLIVLGVIVALIAISNVGG